MRGVRLEIVFETCNILHVEQANLASTEGSIKLTDWIRATAPERPDLLTHLKLQKLAYYCYGALLAFGCEDTIGTVEFEAWKHGPVSRSIYELYKNYTNMPIGRARKPVLPSVAEEHLLDVMNVFGRMAAWQLREESHLEKTPWRDTYNGQRGQVIPENILRAHFRKRFAKPVQFPERLFGSSSLLLDRIPVPTFSTLHEMSKAVTRILGDAL